MSGPNAENIWFSDCFSKKQITFSDSERKTLEYDFDNVLVKILLSNMGIKTTRYFTTVPALFLSIASNLEVVQ